MTQQPQLFCANYCLPEAAEKIRRRPRRDQPSRAGKEVRQRYYFTVHEVVFFAMKSTSPSHRSHTTTTEQDKKQDD